MSQGSFAGLSEFRPASARPKVRGARPGDMHRRPRGLFERRSIRFAVLLLPLLIPALALLILGALPPEEVCWPCKMEVIFSRESYADLYTLDPVLYYPDGHPVCNSCHEKRWIRE